jgi:hypothetical protein
MTCILDTDILSLLAIAAAPAALRIRRRIAELAPEHRVVTTIIVCEEQLRGWMGVRV